MKQSALENALSQNIVPASLQDEIDGILSDLKTANVNLALAEPAKQGDPSLTGLLSTANLSKDQQTTLLTLYSTHDGTIASFWEKVQ